MCGTTTALPRSSFEVNVINLLSFIFLNKLKSVFTAQFIQQKIGGIFQVLFGLFGYFSRPRYFVSLSLFPLLRFNKLRLPTTRLVCRHDPENPLYIIKVRYLVEMQTKYFKAFYPDIPKPLSILCYTTAISKQSDQNGMQILFALINL